MARVPKTGKLRKFYFLIQFFFFLLPSVPTIKTEPLDDYDAALMCSQHGPGQILHPKPYYPPQVMAPMISDLRPCVVGGTYAVSQQRLVARPSSATPCSPSTSPKLHDLAPSPFSKCLQQSGHQPPIPHVSIIQETPGRFQPPDLYPPSSSSSPTDSQPSTPTDAPFSHAPGVTPAQPVSASPGVQELPEPAERGPSSLPEDGSPPPVAVSIKEEPQELDQMYLDDVNEIIRNDLSSISVHSHA
ncbi:nuclear factor of activated T-cells, cytoplasmic 1 [Cyprinodon tularosa]|uniref:nuclear factor of activated T-cells, cytoplasmic 1 n=1 Tax=Cyprinodon tularosa TaxID=77115 RepID=UPI0018E1F7BD|nr:nuclear factor of activated T-cells, cytoplasmic 1 [Cyprinodon tularosa]